jgi:hypothetical protein
MPARYYARRLPLSDSGVHATLVALDTNPCVAAYRSNNSDNWDPCGTKGPTPPGCNFHGNILSQNCTAQALWLNATLAAVPPEDWLFVVGHHPVYDVDEFDLAGMLEAYRVDMYFSGHRHCKFPRRVRRKRHLIPSRNASRLQRSLSSRWMATAPTSALAGVRGSMSAAAATPPPSAFSPIRSARRRRAPTTRTAMCGGGPPLCHRCFLYTSPQDPGGRRLHQPRV